jgi:predicted ATPase/class 3 adenylate cyclase
VIQALDRRLVAVVFTDMVGYTALMHADEEQAVERRDRYWRAVDRQHQAFGGTIVQRLGDGSMSMFPSSLAAVQATVEIQRELAVSEIPVRIGIHVGEVTLDRERLTGEAVNIASRIESFAVPGGVMLSDSAYDHLRNRTDVAVVSLGRFKLKNVGRPVELFAVSTDGIVVPDPRALEGKGERFASLPSNLPEPVGPLLGRATELDLLVASVRDHRVVTITGPGGVGKTRFMVELGRVLASDFLDGVAFIPLADLVEADAFMPALAAALDVKEAEERTLGDGVMSLIGDKKALLLLDNLEQIVSAAPEIARLVAACPGLRIVITSRTLLRIAAEREFPLAPLALPASSDAGSTESLLGYPAVALFVERARASKGSFALTPQNAAAVTEVCRRLDGLPLALELAAARLRVLSPEALLERLDHALNVLTTGPRDTAERHQTLRATIGWSHALLGESEQRLFRRMAVFVGGCTLADVDAVCAEAGETSLEGLESLVDKALVQADGQGDRLRMLQTIGEYAREQLEESGETEDVTRRFVTRYAAIAQHIRDGIEGVDQVGSLQRAVEEDANILSALETLLGMAVAGDEVAAQEGLQMCGDLWMCWHIRGKNVTASEYGTAFLDADRSGRPTVARSGALITAGLGSFALGHLGQADEQWAEAYRVAEQVGAGREMCVAAFSRAFVLIAMGDGAAGRWATDALERSRALGSAWVLAFSLTVHGLARAGSGDTETAEAEYREALQIQEDLGDLEGAGLTLGFFAALCASRGERPRALEMYRRALTGYETIGDRAEEARMHDEMAWTHLLNDDIAEARHHFLASVRAYTDVASVRGVGLAMIGLAAAEAVENRPERAVQLAAAAEVFARQEGIVNVYSDANPGLDFVEQARASLSDADVARATDIGRRLTIKQALDLARNADATPARA